MSTGDVTYPAPEADLARMVATVRANADAWRVDPGRVAVVGFSAGGFVCAALAAGWKTGPFAALASARPEQVRPDAAVLCYPLLDLRVVRDEQLRDPRIDLRVPKTGGKTGRDLVMDYLARVAGEATEERLAEIAPVNHVDRYTWRRRLSGASPMTRRARSCRCTSSPAPWRAPALRMRCTCFDRGGHGLSMANVNTRVDNAAEQAIVRPWFDLAAAFLERCGVA